MVYKELIDMENVKGDMMSQVKESNEEDAAESPTDTEEPGSSIITTEADNIVVNAVQGTPDAELRSGTHSSIDANNKSHSEKLLSSHNEIQPKNIKEALKDADWITAIQDELYQFERNRVWHLVPRPSDRTVIGTGWVFKNKLDEFGNTTRNKARLSKFLLENGFTRGKIDNTLFLKKRGRNLLIVQVYVDDIIFGETNDSFCEEFAKLM
uniref:Mitochondrial protein n=1 Tax=Nicotiana tabacum TaxID=4097 RepID=A0A1S4A9I9_TOBAC|nr:PREDICTED: uncharacterized protein LOC107795226 [Nicotiana tabacum]